LGPGLVTGASDDDPSGIATYSIAGAKTQYATLWTVLFTFPLMTAIQEMAARIGLVTGHGLVGTMKLHYPKVFLYLIVVLVVAANAINIGADLAGMAAASRLLFDIPPVIYGVFYTLFIIATMILIPYHTFARYLKWLTLALFTYIVTAITVDQNWLEIFRSTIFPKISLDSEYILLIVAIFGTTISPYLFFWQANEEVEVVEEEKKVRKLKRHIVTKHELKRMRGDVTAGMFFSNIVMFFIIATTASTLFANGVHQIRTADEAATALKPFAGDFASLLFTLGIVGTGLLAIPILAGSAAYALTEIFGWKEGLDKKFREARAFYLIIVLSTILGFLINLSGINPFTALFYTAVIYGAISPVLLLVLLHMANKKSIMGTNTNGVISNILVGTAFLVMSISVVALLFVF
jgi:NRAMP (natural resistance-associated macrophage protein)-like metal ion transporter